MYLQRVILCLLMLSGLVIAQHKSARELARATQDSVLLLERIGANGERQALGSGFYVRPDVIATNLHVIKGAYWVRVTPMSGQNVILTETYLSLDPENDLALLYIDGGTGKALRLTSTADVEVGDSVHVVGNPEGLQGSFSSGVVSGFRQIANSRWIQISAPLSSGSSGGPVIDSEGAVVGVAVASHRLGQNLNFAVPSDYVTALLLDIKQGARPKSLRSTVLPEIPSTTKEGRELIYKVVESLGGKEKVAGIKAARAEIVMLMKGPQGEMEIKGEQTQVYPDRIHQRMATPMGEMLMVVSPGASFQAMGGQSRDLPATVREDTMKSLKRDTIYVAQHADDPSFTFAGGAKEKVGEIEAQVLDISGDGMQVRWWVDPTSGRILQTAYKGMSQQGPAETVTTFSEWKDFNGLTLPAKGTRKVNGNDVGSMTLVNYTPNPQVDAKIFEKP